MKKRRRRAAIEKAIECVGGTQADLARTLNVSQGIVSHWLTNRRRITAERAVQIEGATKRRVTRGELRPDLFGRPT